MLIRLKCTEIHMNIQSLLTTFNHGFTLWVIFPAIIALGLYLTLRLRFVQVFRLKQSFRCLTKKDLESEGNISHFQAISSVLAGNFGTGNISGMAVALSTGGPGALVWMWIMVFFGATIQYASCILGICYRKKNEKHEYVGGPMYYLRDGLKMKWAASLFSIFTLFGAFTVGNLAQINSVILPLEKLGMNSLLCCTIIAALVGCVILGGIQRISSYASIIVPFKAALYLGTALVIIGMNYEKVIPAFQLMFQHAFGFESFAGGLAGAGVLKAITTGFDRGLFATDLGTGIVPIIQASARSKHPVVDGIATLIAPLMVMIVCTATGLVLIMTGAWLEPGLQSTNMVTYAFSKGLGDWDIGGYIVIVALILFAYTTILAWAYCGEKALEYLTGPKKAKYFRFLYLLVIPLGALLNVSLIWILADIAITLMVVINIIGVAGLSKQVITSTREYKKAQREQRKDALTSS